MLDQLTLLVDKSLVVAENAGGTTRYRLLETVRQYALEKLGESGEADAVRARHRDHYTAMAALLDAPAARRLRAARRAGGDRNRQPASRIRLESGEQTTSHRRWSWRRRCNRSGWRGAAFGKGGRGSTPLR